MFKFGEFWFLDMCYSECFWWVGHSSHKIFEIPLQDTGRLTIARYGPILLMEEILPHLRCIKPCKQWDIIYINWCRISAINSSNWIGCEYFQDVEYVVSTSAATCVYVINRSTCLLGISWSFCSCTSWLLPIKMLTICRYALFTSNSQSQRSFSFIQFLGWWLWWRGCYPLLANMLLKQHKHFYSSQSTRSPPSGDKKIYCRLIVSSSRGIKTQYTRPWRLKPNSHHSFLLGNIPPHPLKVST